MRKVKIYTKHSLFNRKQEARKILEERVKTKEFLGSNYPYNNLPATEQHKRFNEDLESIAKELPTETFRYDGYFHCWKQASDEDSHWAIGIVEDEDGWCHEEECRNIKFEEWE